MEPDAIPIFPLASVVLFPLVHAPLHIFEPRYRAMTRDALAADGRIGMVTIRPEEANASSDLPTVFPIGCEGVIRESRRYDDGRYDLLLEGTRRFRIRNELAPPPAEGRLYRVAEVERLDDPFPEADGDAVRATRGEVAELVAQLVRRAAAARADELIETLERLDDVPFVNTLSQSIDFSSLEKQGLLESAGVRERFERLRDLLRFRLADVRGGAPGGAETLH